MYAIALQWQTIKNKAMSEINLTEILKDAPKGTELWSVIHGPVKFKEVIGYIICQTDRLNNNTDIHFDEEGHWIYDVDRQKRCYFSESIVLFPSRDCLSWRNFKAPWMHKHFEPFQKVLISHFTDNFPIKEIWVPALYGYYDEEIKAHILTNGSSRDDDGIISYESNKVKLGKPVK